jgi:hypothetical protein
MNIALVIILLLRRRKTPREQEEVERVRVQENQHRSAILSLYMGIRRGIRIRMHMRYMGGRRRV